jgi:hypothetical protein
METVAAGAPSRFTERAHADHQPLTITMRRQSSFAATPPWSAQKYEGLTFNTIDVYTQIWDRTYVDTTGSGVSCQAGSNAAAWSALVRSRLPPARR